VKNFKIPIDRKHSGKKIFPYFSKNSLSVFLLNEMSIPINPNELKDEKCAAKKKEVRASRERSAHLLV
jgi:hypothetical protein